MNLKLGCNLRGMRSLLRLVTYLAGLPAAPASWDWEKYAGARRMHLNDTLGDCVVVAVVNLIQTWTGCDAKRALYIADSVIEMVYDKLSPNDEGLVIREFLDYMRTTGISGHKIAAHVDVTPSHIESVQQCIYRLGGIDVGWNVYSVDMDDFRANIPFGTKKHRSKGSLEGGHSTASSRYTASKKYKMLIGIDTWATCIDCTWDWWCDRLMEAHGVVAAKDWTGPDNKSPLGDNLKKLIADAKAL